MRYGRSQPKVPAGEAGWNGWRRARSAWVRHALCSLGGGAILPLGNGREGGK
jgi:hypothetical protein